MFAVRLSESRRTKMFSKSDRFREKSSDVPPPGAYNVDTKSNLSGPISFDKSGRFKVGDYTDSSFNDSVTSAETPCKLKTAHNKSLLKSNSVKKIAYHEPISSDNHLLRISELEEEVGMLTTECCTLKKQLQASRQEVTRLESSVQAEAGEKAELEKKFAALNESTVSCNKARELEALIVQLQVDVSSLTEANQLLTQDLDKANQTCKASELEVTECKNQIASDSQDKQLLETLLCQLQEERSKMLADLAKQELVTVDAATASKELRTELRAFQSQTEELKTEKQNLQLNIEALKNEVKDIEKEGKIQASEHQQTLEGLTRKCLTFEEEAAHQKQVRKEVEAILKSELMVMEASRKKLEKENQVTLRIIKDKECQLSELREQLASLSHEQDQDKGSLEAKLIQVMGIAEEWKEKEATQRSKLEQVRLENKQLHTDREQANRQFTDIREKLNSVENLECSVKSKNTEDIHVEETKQNLEPTKLQHENKGNKTLNSDLLARIAELEAEVKRLCGENESLKQALTDMEEKYRPFQEMIDSLEDQNKLLRSQTLMAQQEAQRLSEQYAKLLGHQNQKQKIQHVKKLKDENASLKQEVTQLKSDISRHKRTIQRLEEERGPPTAQAKKPLSTRN